MRRQRPAHDSTRSSGLEFEGITALPNLVAAVMSSGGRVGYGRKRWALFDRRLPMQRSSKSDEALASQGPQLPNFPIHRCSTRVCMHPTPLRRRQNKATAHLALSRSPPDGAIPRRIVGQERRRRPGPSYVSTGSGAARSAAAGDKPKDAVSLADTQRQRGGGAADRWVGDARGWGPACVRASLRDATPRAGCEWTAIGCGSYPTQGHCRRW